MLREYLQTLGEVKDEAGIYFAIRACYKTFGKYFTTENVERSMRKLRSRPGKRRVLGSILGKENFMFWTDEEFEWEVLNLRLNLLGEVRTA